MRRESGKPEAVDGVLWLGSRCRPAVVWAGPLPPRQDCYEVLRGGVAGSAPVGAKPVSTTVSGDLGPEW